MECKKIKVFILAMLFAMMTPLLAAPQGSEMKEEKKEAIIWFRKYDDAVKEAKKSSRPLFLFFTGSNWCGYCKSMEREVFSDPVFIKEMASTFVFVDIDFPRPNNLPKEIVEQNEKLKGKYAITGFPTVIIIDSQGNTLATTGYRPGGGKAYADFLRSVLSNPANCMLREGQF